MSIIHIGRYRHYKGREYTVIGVARHSENEEELVVYRKEYDDHGLWVRQHLDFNTSGHSDDCLATSQSKDSR